MGAEMDERSGGDAGTPHRGTLTRAFPFKKKQNKMKLFERVPRAVARTYPAVGDAVNPRERPSRARGHHVDRSCRRVRSWLRRRRAFWLG